MLNHRRWLLDLSIPVAGLRRAGVAATAIWPLNQRELLTRPDCIGNQNAMTPRHRIGLASRRLLALAPLLLVSGCSSIPWFGGDVDPHPPTPLTDLKPEMAVKTLWSKEIGDGTEKRRLELVPAVQGNRLFVADVNGLITALGTADGKILWQRETKLPFSGGPDADASRLLIGCDNGDLVALSAADGAQIWRTAVDSEILSVPRLADGTVVLHTLNDDIYGFDVTNGKQKWRFTYTAPVLTLRGSSSPTIVGQDAIVGLSGGKLVDLNVETGVPGWEVTVSEPHGRTDLERIDDIDSDPVVMDGTIYVGTYNGDLAAVDLKSGTVLWRRVLSTYAGLAATSGMLYISDSQDNVWAARASDGAGVWKQTSLKYRHLSPPAVIGDLVAVGDFEGYIHWLSRSDGRIVARTKAAGGRITARPVAVGGILYVYGNDGTVTALAPGPAPLARPPGPATRVERQPATPQPPDSG
jgi:outer membrane protein assembly factor BamB